MVVHILERDSLEVMYVLGEGGRQPGMYSGTHGIVSDTLSNFYTTETYEGKREQKFAHRGRRPVTQLRSGPAWPDGQRLEN